MSSKLTIIGTENELKNEQIHENNDTNIKNRKQRTTIKHARQIENKKTKSLKEQEINSESNIFFQTRSFEHERYSLSTAILTNEKIVSAHSSLPIEVKTEIEKTLSPMNINRLLAEALTFIAYEEIKGNNNIRLKISEGKEKLILSENLGTNGIRLPFPYFTIWIEAMDRVALSLISMGYDFIEQSDDADYLDDNYIITHLSQKYEDNVHVFYPNRLYNGKYFRLSYEKTENGIMWCVRSIYKVESRSHSSK